MNAALNIYLSVILWWAAFPIAATIFGVAIHGIWKLAARCWRDHQFAKECAALLGDNKPGAGPRGLLEPTSRGTTGHAGPRNPPFDWAS